MPINFSDIGIHKNVFSIVFGNADILMTCCKRSNGERMILFHNQEGEPGSEVNGQPGQTSDDLPCPELVMIFNEPGSIACLIQSLIEIQKSMLI